MPPLLSERSGAEAAEASQLNLSCELLVLLQTCGAGLNLADQEISAGSTFRLTCRTSHGDDCQEPRFSPFLEQREPELQHQLRADVWRPDELFKGAFVVLLAASPALQL